MAVRRLLFISALAVSSVFTACNDQDFSPSDSQQIQQPILNGERDYSNQAVVSLLIPENDVYQEYLFCSGTLIHPQWVLTAAHCLTETKKNTDDEGNVTYTVTPNEDNDDTVIGVYKSEKSKSLYPASEMIWHPEYGPDDVGFDIALVKLKTPIENVTPMLPHPPWLALTSEDLPVDMQEVGFGYDERGRSEVKRSITQPMTAYCGKFNPPEKSDEYCYVGTVIVNGCHPDKELCEEYGRYDQVEEEVTLVYGSIYNSMETGGQCSGDSGGPALWTKGGVTYVSTVTSYGDDACRAYNISTAVQDFYDWIIEHAPEVAAQYKEICGNGVDDDGNGLADGDDPVCQICGNGTIEGSEPCDLNAFKDGKSACNLIDSKYASGSATCKADCTLDLSACVLGPVCGNSVVEGDELCDMNAFKDGKSACNLIDSKYTSGNATCKADCTLDLSACVEPSKDPEDPNPPATDKPDTPVNPDKPGESSPDSIEPTKKSHKKSGCSAAPYQSAPASGALLFAIAGLFGLIRRRKISR